MGTVPSPSAPPARLTVRVGLAWNPFDRESVPGPRFWDAVELMEELRYDSLWLSDTATRPGPSPLPVLAAVAARTERLKIGTSVLVAPPRQPVLLAKELATIDVLSGGRFLPAFGLGVDLPAELAALGIAGGERVARLEEAIAVMRALWSGEPATFQGRFTQFDGLQLTPRPLRRRLEIWLGGASAPALRRVGRVADGWLASFCSPETFARGVEAIRAAAAEAGRTIDEDHYGTIVFAADTIDDLPPLEQLGASRSPDLRPDDHIAIGPDALQPLLQRFRDGGGTKFVVVPLAREGRLLPFLRELKTAVVDPFEATA
jgi:probable F420-dependent oxidoreductase